MSENTWTLPTTSDLRTAQREADRVIKAAVSEPARPETLTGRIDGVLLHPVWGLLILLTVLFVMFQAVFTAAGPLADLIIAASAKTQIIVVTHAQPLVTDFRDGSAQVLELVKEDGRTLLDGQGILDEPAWHWPSR